MGTLQLTVSLILALVFAIFTSIMTISHAYLGFCANLTTNEHMNCKLPWLSSHYMTRNGWYRFAVLCVCARARVRVCD